MNANEIQTLINQYMVSVEVNDEEAARYVDKLSQFILSDQLSLLNFIKFLGDYLTRDDDLIRPKAINCLSATLARIGEVDAIKLSKQDVGVLIDFYLSKLEDKASMTETFSGLITLVGMKRFATTNLEKVVTSLLKNYDPKSHLARVRYLGFKLVNTLLDKFQTFLSTNYNDLLIRSFINVASGEKDPRNLLISFELNSTISKNFVTDAFSDELFDICFCYFPISFSPPKDDPYKITSEDLKSALRNTIASNTLFAKDSFPNLIEKLTSTNMKVKNDVLETILLCVEDYSIETILQFWLTLWDALKFEILHNDLSTFESTNAKNSNFPIYDKSNENNDDIETLVLVFKVFQAMSSKLNESPNTEDLDNYLETVWKELKDNLTKPDAKLFKQSILILAVISEANTDSFNILVSRALGEIFTFIKNEPSISVPKQRTLIENIGFFLNSYIQLILSLDALSLPDFLSSNKLFSFKDEFLMFLGKSLVSSSKLEVTLRSLAIDQLIKLINLPQFLSNNEISSILQYFNELLINDDNEITCNKCIDGLVNIIRHGENNKIQLILDIVLPSLFELLPDSGTDAETGKTKSQILEIISKISINKQILEYLSIRILNKLSSLANAPVSVDYVNLLTATLTKIIQQTQQDVGFLMTSWYKNFIPRFIAIFFKIWALQANHMVDEVDNFNVYVELSGNLLNLIIKNVEKSKHQELVTEIANLFLKGEASSLLATPLEGVNTNVLKTPSNLINVFVKLIGAVDISVKLDIDHDELASQLLKQSVEVEDRYIKLGYLQSLALVLNKFPVSSDFLSEFEESTRSLISKDIISGELSENSIKHIEVLTWITKSLILRNDSLGLNLVNYILELLNNELTSVYASKSLEILITDLSIFTKNGKLVSGVVNINVRLLYKQKIFEVMIRTIIESFASTSNQTLKENYLVTLACILKNVSSKMILPHIPEFLPLVLQSLDIENSSVKYASLLTLYLTIDELPDLISQHLQTLVPKLLDLTVTSKINDEKIRSKGLECLILFATKLELTKIVPYQKGILRNLIQPLDDKKRNVRKLACDCRQEFYELGRESKK